MSFYQISSKELRTKSAELLTLSDRFETEKQSLISYENTLNSMWQGEANIKFHQAFLRDSGQMDAFRKVIDSYARMMITIAERYELAEAKNLNIASSRTY